MFSRSKRIELKGLDPLAKPSKIRKDLTDIWVALPDAERRKWKGIEEVINVETDRPWMAKTNRQTDS